MFCSARRNNNATAPTIPGDFTTIYSSANAGADRPAMAWGWKRCASGSETTGTWTNASSIFCVIYRGCKASGDVIGSGKQNPNGTNAAAIPWASVTFDVTNGSSWGVSAGAIDGTISGDADINADYGNMVNFDTSTVNLHTVHHSNGGVTGITGGNSGTLSSKDYNAVGFELLAEPDAAGHPTMRRWGGVTHMSMRPLIFGRSW